MLRKVLIVDDAPLVHTMFGIIMRDYGASMVTAMNGQEGLNALRTDSDIDLVLLDMEMPVMNGVDFLRNASLEGFSERIPVIVVTSADTCSTEVRMALDLGARAALKKIFSPGRLRSIVDDFVALPAA